MQLSLIRIAALVATVAAVPQGWGSWNPETSKADAVAAGSATGNGWSATTGVATPKKGKQCHGKGHASSMTLSSPSDSAWSAWSGSGSSSGGPAFYSAPVPTATLSPAPHWGHDPSDPQYVVPSDNGLVYYATNGDSSPSLPHQMAWLTANYTSEAVILDHSNLFSYTYDTASNDVLVTFNTLDSFQLAQQHWSTDDALLFILHDASCSEGGSCYLEVNTLDFDQTSLTCSAECSSVGFEQAVSFFDLEWGVHRPGKKAPLPSGTTKGPGSKSTGTSTSHSTTTTAATSGSGSGTSTSTSASTTASTSGSISTSTLVTTSSLTPVTTSTSTAPYPTTTSSTNSTTSNNTIAAGNYTDGGSANTDDCTAPVDTKYGLPTACLTSFFDEDLDDSYGYEDSDETDFNTFIAQFNDLFYPDPLPEDSSDSSEDGSDDSELGLTKRFSLVPKFVSNFVAKVLPIEGVTTPYTKEIQLLTLPLNLPQQRTTVDSPWGQQVLIKSFSKTSSSNADNTAKLDVYCVDCGMQGTADITGNVGISVLEGISSLGATLRADMAMTLKVGVDASLVYTQTFSQDLFNVPLSPLCIANVICVGPYMKLGADLTLTANANGQLLAGASIALHNAVASIDVAAFTASASGWQPEFNPTFQANGNIDVSAEVGLPLAVVLGINILNGKFSREASIVDRPSIVASAAVAASASLNADGQIQGGATATDGCVGIKTSLELKNQVYAVIPGTNNIMLSDPPAMQLQDGCIALPADPSSTTTSDDPTTTTASDPTDTTTPDPTTTTSDSSTDPTTTSDSDTSATTTSDATTTIDSSNPDPTDTNKKIRRGSLHGFYPRQNNSTTNGTIIDTTSQTLSNGTVNTTAYIQPDGGDKAYNLTAGYDIAVLIDTQANYQILPCANGNLLLFGINETVPDYQCGDMWTMRQGDQVVVSDGMARIPVFYPDEMSQTGVSRIRLHDVENIPVGAEEIVFVPADADVSDGDTDPLYFPMDKDANTYYSMVCVFSDGNSSRMFLASDPTNGLSMLQSADVMYSITGGVVKECYYLPLIQGLGYDTGDDDGYDTSVDDGDDSDS